MKTPSVGLMDMKEKKYPKVKQEADVCLNPLTAEISLEKIAWHWQKIAARISVNSERSAQEQVKNP